MTQALPAAEALGQERPRHRPAGDLLPGPARILPRADETIAPSANPLCVLTPTPTSGTTPTSTVSPLPTCSTLSPSSTGDVTVSPATSSPFCVIVPAGGTVAPTPTSTGPTLPPCPTASPSGLARTGTAGVGTLKAALIAAGLVGVVFLLLGAFFGRRPQGRH
ncbi:hypothetical protein ACIP6P_12300 [Streptomyces sp. NPDC088729]|uniref:hypothetical protein n=1 Tax=unclassified Streptomyces TaxID=2593676 RepID=UPI000F552867|nr:hypothetical protein [Streptomyces sp. ADI96-02]